MQQKFEHRTFNFKMTKKKNKQTFEASRLQFSRQKKENIFPKEFFHKIWLINKECKYNYIDEIKLEKNYLVTIIRDKTSFE